MATQRFHSRLDRLIALWILRVFSPSLGRSVFLNNSGYADSDIAEFLGLPLRLDEATIREIPRMLDDLQISLEKARPASLPALARDNFTRFAVSLKLNTTEQRILEFFACMETEPPLADTGRVTRKIIGAEAPRFLARVLDLPRNAVAKALAPGGRMMKCGLLKRTEHPHKIARLEFHSEALAVRLLRDSYNPGKLLKLFGVVTPSSPELGLEDFPHLQTSLNLLVPYLKTVQAKRKPGVNVLIHGAPGILKAQGHPDPAKESIQLVQPGLYDIGHLNTSADLSQIAANLRKSPSARLCLYGPPGTGKTSFGHWLANEIGQPLLLRKASDLLSPYVGVTEQKIARTFETAKQDGAVLLIDEVDSFLRDRTQTRHSWEVTQINEMLTQIESFPGILIASTNLIGQLDPASMRRFDIKLHFGYLLPDQASRLFVSYCQNLKLPRPTSADLELAATMDVSAPGDFAAVARQHRFQPFRDAHSLLQAVIAESELKAQRSRRIGFQ